MTKAMGERLATGYRFGNASPAPTTSVSHNPDVASQKYMHVLIRRSLTVPTEVCYKSRCCARELPSGGGEVR